MNLNFVGLMSGVKNLWLKLKGCERNFKFEYFILLSSATYNISATIGKLK